ncbi:MAG: hypothetical protein JWO09_3389 [Bacteroidetes bacterium]|nr:hypothetical protein [Bacteroidota bacterium]
MEAFLFVIIREKFTLSEVEGSPSRTTKSLHESGGFFVCICKWTTYAFARKADLNWNFYLSLIVMVNSNNSFSILIMVVSTLFICF